MPTVRMRRTPTWRAAPTRSPSSGSQTDRCAWVSTTGASLGGKPPARGGSESRRAKRRRRAPAPAPRTPPTRRRGRARPPATPPNGPSCEDRAREARRVGDQRMQTGLVERLERNRPGGDLGDRLQRWRVERVRRSGPSSPAVRPGAVDHQHGDPLSGRGQEDRRQERDRRDHDHARRPAPRPGPTTWSGHQSPAIPVIRSAISVDGQHVGRRDPGRACEPRQRSIVRRPRGRTISGCSRPDLGVAPDHAEGQEDRQHRAQEEDREQRQPEDRRARERGRVEHPLGAARSCRASRNAKCAPTA